jgi:hypothetical protein
LIGEASEEEDALRNTDLIVLRLEAVRIACRIRRYEYMARYGDEFTIRCDRPRGTKTELAKIIEGWGDYFFYGFAAAEGDNLARWLLGDLKVFRLWFMRYLAAEHRIPGTRRQNHDGSSGFIAFAVADMPRDFIVATGQ